MNRPLASKSGMEQLTSLVREKKEYYYCIPADSQPAAMDVDNSEGVRKGSEERKE